MNTEKIQLFEDYIGDINNVRLFMKLISHRETKVISDGKKFTEVAII